ncbi:MAG TPA: hypothetical protein VFR96_04335 [Povalibacter sp.]|nr:hypothetical protein [Povalibacter sp.]
MVTRWNMRREYPAVLYRTALAAFLSVTLAGAATATTTQSADPVDAIWKVQTLPFVYRSSATFYNCDVLRQKLRAILLVAGAHPSVNISAQCGSGLSNHIVAQIAVATPVAATPENIETATHFDTTDELIARLHRVALPDASTLAHFTANWREQSLSSIRDVRITLADCELLQDLEEQIFSHIDVELVQKRPGCNRMNADSGFAGAGRPNIRLRALIPVADTRA